MQCLDRILAQSAEEVKVVKKLDGQSYVRVQLYCCCHKIDTPEELE